MLEPIQGHGACIDYYYIRKVSSTVSIWLTVLEPIQGRPPLVHSLPSTMVPTRWCRRDGADGSQVILPKDLPRMLTLTLTLTLIAGDPSQGPASHLHHVPACGGQRQGSIDYYHIRKVFTCACLWRTATRQQHHGLARGPVQVLTLLIC